MREDFVGQPFRLLGGWAANPKFEIRNLRRVGNIPNSEFDP
jgi:hypothetical protein